MAKKMPSRVGLSILLGMLAAYASAIMAGGQGWSPLVFLAFGGIGPPLIVVVTRRWLRSWPWTELGLAVALIGAAAFPLARYSTRIDATEAFVRVFKEAPPQGLTVLAARRQWYDGINYILSFHCDAAAINSLISRRPYRDLSNETVDAHRMRLAVPFADPSSVMPKSYVGTRLWEYLAEGPRAGSVVVSWDERSSIGIIVSWED